jgi:hypothetical protein
MRCLVVSILAFVALWGRPAAAADLRNDRWSVSIDPSTLAIEATVDGNRVQASKGGLARAVSDLKTTSSTLSWRWPGYAVSATLDGDDLALGVTADDPGELTVIEQPAASYGDALLLPLAEGHYIPAGHAVWQAFLAERHDAINTSEELSLPLWGNQYKGFALHWVLTQPFGNTLGFRRDGHGLAVSLRHEFSKLDPNQPMTMILHRSGDDMLAGARRYRRWLIDHGKFENLTGKIARHPATGKLLGASHVYLSGGLLLSLRDIRDWPAFIATLKGDHPLAGELRARMDTESLRMLAAGVQSPSGYPARTLLAGINAAADALARKRWIDQAITPHSFDGYRMVRDDIATLFGSAVADDVATWGDSVSIRDIQALSDHGLKRLWLGTGMGWEPGLWHPEAVQRAVDLGYLIAPYDSYETALAPGDNPDWTTAHMGTDIKERCAIVKANGTLKTGFNQQGNYTDPRCVFPVLKDRVRTLHAASPYNSWFLDAYATGMVFENHAPNAPMGLAAHADAYTESLRWPADTLGLVVGSENGNATTSLGVAFGHGLHTPVIGWFDPDLGQSARKNKKSKYFLGSWYPRDEPDVFFKAVPTKPLYRTVHFDPRYRLPLYQAVFHDSIISTHHWTFDNLKASDLVTERELVQLLYNVPPLYHLSATSMTRRLPIIKRQDAFFRPLHERLATQALTSFRFVDAQHNVQETRFADGTRLVANFSDQTVSVDGEFLPPKNIRAVVPGMETSTYRAGLP